VNVILNKTLMIMLWFALSSIPRPLWATDSCFECVLGIWDDPALSSNLGEIVAGQPKDIYVGIKFAGGVRGVSGISLTIAGLRAFLVTSVAPIVSLPAFVCDYIGAPADTSMSSSATGGCSFYWPGCLVGDQALLRVTLLASSNVTNALLQVKRQYPPAYPDVRTPFVHQCGPEYTPTRVKGGYYILNWNGDPTVRAGEATWSLVKHVYR